MEDYLTANDGNTDLVSDNSETRNVSETGELPKQTRINT